MKNTTPIASLLVMLVMAGNSSTAVAGNNNCQSYWPKVPYNCVVMRVETAPVEKADFSAFETGASKSSVNRYSKTRYKLRSVPRDVARRLRSQNN